MIGLRLAFKHWILTFLGVAVLFISLGRCNALSWQELTAATPTPTASDVMSATITSAQAMDSSVVMVGKQVREITSFERGKKVAHQLTTCTAVVTLIDDEVQGIILHPLAVVANGSRKSDGRSRPVFGLEVISVDNLESIDQGVSEYRLERIELDIGKLNRFSFGQNLEPQSDMQLVVKLFVDDKAVDEDDQYYVEFNYDRTIDSRIAIQTMVIPLYEYQWTVIKGGLDIAYVTEEQI
jgi:hypothetical protein